MPKADIAAERAVLSGLLNHGGKAYLDVSDIVQLDSFSNEFNKAIYKCCQYVLEKDSDTKIDQSMILSSAKSLKLDDFFKGKVATDSLKATALFPVQLENVRTHAAKIRRLQIANLLVKQLDQAKIDIDQITGDESLQQILGIAENRILDFSSLLIGDNDSIKFGNNVEKYVEFLENNVVDNIGLSSGFSIYDKIIGGGYRRGTINIIGARPKVGKTAHADNIGIFNAKSGIPVLNLDTEMLEEDHLHRILAILSGVKINTIETGKFRSDTGSRGLVRGAASMLKDMPYYWHSVAGKPFEEILAIMRRWLFKTVGTEKNGKAKPCLIIYDYLKLMDGTDMGKMQEYQAIGFQISSLHNFMVKYGVPCAAYVQLNRDGISGEDTDVISQSDRISWLCSNFAIFKAKTQEEILNEKQYCGNRKLVPIFARHGEGCLDMGDYINMNFKKDIATIVEGKTRNEIFRSQKRREIPEQNDSEPF